MRVAVLADIHANLPALTSVLDVVDGLAPDEVLVLGDIVGYNAQPVECLELIRERRFSVVVGNHDHDAVFGTPSLGTHAAARWAQEWTREQLSPEARRHLAELPNLLLSPAGMVAVHGCYLNDKHFTGYVTSTMLPENLRAVAANETWPRLALVGHTHCPMVGWLEGDRVVEPPLEREIRWPADARAVLINPGAVGQPRDGDPRAAFALIDIRARTVTQYRVGYDVARTCDAIVRAGLPLAIAERLGAGV